MNKIITRVTNLDDLCRACLSNNTNRRFNIFSGKCSSKNTYCSVLRECTSIQVFEDDGLSLYICDMCALFLETYVTFRQRCSDSQTTLKKLCEEASESKTTSTQLKPDNIDECKFMYILPSPVESNRKNFCAENEKKILTDKQILCFDGTENMSSFDDIVIKTEPPEPNESCEMTLQEYSNFNDFMNEENGEMQENVDKLKMKRKPSQSTQLLKKMSINSLSNENYEDFSNMDISLDEFVPTKEKADKSRKRHYSKFSYKDLIKRMQTDRPSSRRTSQIPSKYRVESDVSTQKHKIRKKKKKNVQNKVTSQPVKTISYSPLPEIKSEYDIKLSNDSLGIIKNNNTDTIDKKASSTRSELIFIQTSTGLKQIPLLKNATRSNQVINILSTESSHLMNVESDGFNRPMDRYGSYIDLTRFERYPRADYIKSQKDRQMLIDGPFLYLRDKVSSPGRVLWKCNEYRTQRCLARRHTVGPFLVKEVNEHCHDPDRVGLFVMNHYKKIREKLQELNRLELFPKITSNIGMNDIRKKLKEIDDGNADETTLIEDMSQLNELLQKEIEQY